MLTQVPVRFSGPCCFSLVICISNFLPIYRLLIGLQFCIDDFKKISIKTVSILITVHSAIHATRECRTRATHAVVVINMSFYLLKKMTNQKVYWYRHRNIGPKNIDERIEFAPSLSLTPTATSGWHSCCGLPVAHCGTIGLSYTQLSMHIMNQFTFSDLNCKHSVSLNSIRWPLIPVNVGPSSRTQTRFVLRQLDYLSQSQKSLRVWILFHLRVEVQAVGGPTWTTISHTSATVSGVGTPGLSPLAFNSPLRFYSFNL